MSVDDVEFYFQDALRYQGPVYRPGNNDDSDGILEGVEPIPLSQVESYESAMQYASLSPDPALSCNISQEEWTALFKSTIERCSLIRNAFQVVAEGDSYEEVAGEALKKESFEDMMQGGINEDATWSIRLRRYGSVEDEVVTNSSGTQGKKKQQQARYGKNVRSPLTDERNAIMSMADLVQLFRGKVNLANPDCKIYLLEGLKRRRIVSSDGEEANAEGSKILLTRILAVGPKVRCCYMLQTSTVKNCITLCIELGLSLCSSILQDFNLCTKDENMCHHNTVMPYRLLHSMQHSSTTKTFQSFYT